MRWSFLLALSLGASAGCDRSERKRQTAVEEFETLSRDLCLRNWLSDAQRTRITEGFRTGRLPPERVDAYIAAVRKKGQYAEKSNLDNESFCRLQRNVFRQHFMQ
jgi:hypothetical protein